MLFRRLCQLYVGLALFGLSLALMIRARLGLPPWDVLHQGAVATTGLSFGAIVTATGALTLLLWIPLRQRPGLGTISNVVLIGFSADLALVVIAEPVSLAMRMTMLLSGIALNGLATAMYITSGFGPGPRDGLMTGLAARTGRSLRRVRTVIELFVLGLGWVLGGTAGAGTVLYALLVGPIIQKSVQFFQRRRANPPADPVATACA